MFAYRKTLWPEFASELCQPSDCSLLAKLVPSFADRGVSCIQRCGSPTAVISNFYTEVCLYNFQYTLRLREHGLLALVINRCCSLLFTERKVNLSL
jgi:hypothetical protein